MRKIVFASAIICSGIPTFGAAYNFTSVANTTGQFSSFFAPSINNHGDVAFRAGYDAGGRGIYVASGGSLTPLATTGTSYTSLSDEVHINDSGLTVFTAGAGTPGNSSSYVIAADSTGTAFSYAFTSLNANVASTSINTAGSVSFFMTNGDDISVVTGKGGPLQTVGALGGLIKLMILYPVLGTAINDSGTVAFMAVTDDGYALFTGGTGTPAMLLSASGPFNQFASVAENNAGTIVFNGGMDDGSNAIDTIDADHTLQTIVSTGSSFTNLLNPSINNKGEVLFFGVTASNGKAGLFTGSDPVDDKVIAVGDPLFGRTVTSLTDLSQSLNDSGQVAFRAVLDDGNSYIVVATPVPEPASLAMLSLSAILLLKRRKP